MWDQQPLNQRLTQEELEASQPKASKNEMRQYYKSNRQNTKAKHANKRAGVKSKTQDKVYWETELDVPVGKR